MSEWEMYVWPTNQIGSTINSQSKFLFLWQVNVTIFAFDEVECKPNFGL